MRTGARWGVGWAGGAVCGARRTVAGTRRAIGRTGGTVCCSPACTETSEHEGTEHQLASASRTVSTTLVQQ